MEITITNCNCLNEAKIKIDTGKVNIKYAMNGTGKSTISRSIQLHVEGHNAIKALMPFKHRDKGDDPQFFPTVIGADQIKSIKIFNEDYINQFVFKPDEVISNSFNIFIRNTEYDLQMLEIENTFAEIKDTFKDNKKLDQVITDLTILSNSFGKSASGYSKAGSLHKGLGNGNKLENIPANLQPYKHFLQSSNNVKWLKWQIGGKEFLDKSDECPYCVAPTGEEKRKTILSISEEYDSKAIEHLNNILEVLENLNQYFSEDTKEKLGKITKNPSTISDEEINYLKEIKGNSDLLNGKLSALKNVSFFSFKDVDKVLDKITDLKIKIDFLPKLDSPITREIVNSVNKSLDTIIAKGILIQKAIGIHKSNIKKTIKLYKDEINNFLKYAGYRYYIDIEDEDDAYKMKLKHQDFDGTLQSGTQHLSYGEKNAFSLVLFMYQAIRDNPDLVVLDDPISSFDRNKKFAILDKLFRGDKSFKGKTVLLMTHDLEPIIDMIHCLPGKFDMPSACFLELSDGNIVERPITKSDIVTFGQVCSEIITSTCDDIIKLFYLRRHYEVLNDKDSAYQLLSNLFHKRPVPEWIEHGEHGPQIRNMTAQEIDDATIKIGNQIAVFDYQTMLTKITDDATLLALYNSAENNYEKLQLFRVINKNKALHDSDVIAKYINEAFHIENEYLMQLNPKSYETTPKFIIDECDRLLA